MRHYNTIVLFAVQYLRTGIPVLRELVHYAIIFKSRRHDTLKAIYTEFGTLFETFDEFKQHFFEITNEKYNAMLYDRDLDLDENYMKIKFPNMDNVNVKLEF